MDLKTSTRLKLLKIWEILTSKSSPEKPLSSVEILSELEDRGVVCDRRTLYGDMDLLKEAGYGVKVVRAHENLYYVDGTALTKRDVEIIVDAVRQISALSPVKKARIVKNLTGERFSRENITPHEVLFGKKSVYGDLFDKIATIDDAVKAGKKIGFVKCGYVVNNGAFEVRRAEKEVVTPVAVSVYDGNYYLSFVKGNEFNSVPVEFISEVAAEDEDGGKLPFRRAALDKKISESVAGKSAVVTFIASVEAAADVVMKFGTLLAPVNQGKDKFSFNAEVPVGAPLFIWCASTHGKVKINAPVKVKEEYEKFLSDLCGGYLKR